MTKIEVDDVKCLALLDSRTQLSTITITCIQKLSVPIHKLDQLLEIEAMGGCPL